MCGGGGGLVCMCINNHAINLSLDIFIQAQTLTLCYPPPHCTHTHTTHTPYAHHPPTSTHNLHYRVFLIDKYQVSTQQANVLNSLVYIISAIVSPFLGILVDRTGFNLFWSKSPYTHTHTHTILNNSSIPQAPPPHCKFRPHTTHTLTQ